MRKLLTVAGLAIGLLLVGGVAVASIPDAAGVIHGCRKNSDGSLKVIDSATQTCASGYTALNWSQTGPPGISGLVNVANRVTIAGNSVATVLAVCEPSGGNKRALGGGFELLANNMRVLASGPNTINGQPASGWVVLVANDNPGPADAVSSAVCATVGS